MFHNVHEIISVLEQRRDTIISVLTRHYYWGIRIKISQSNMNECKNVLLLINIKPIMFQNQRNLYQYIETDQKPCWY
jgi:hypothetical protein